MKRLTTLGRAGPGYETSNDNGGRVHRQAQLVRRFFAGWASEVAPSVSQVGASRAEGHAGDGSLPQDRLLPEFLAVPPNDPPHAIVQLRGCRVKEEENP